MIRRGPWRGQPHSSRGPPIYRTRRQGAKAELLETLLRMRENRSRAVTDKINAKMR